MRLKRRLEALEPTAIKSWREGWEQLIEKMLDHTPQAVADRLELALQALKVYTEAELEQHRKTLKPGQAEAELLEALEGVPLHGLDLPAFVA